MLQSRQSFGTISIGGQPFSSANLQRLLKLDIFEKLACRLLVFSEDVLLPLSVKVKALSCHVWAEYIRPEELDSVEITAKDLQLTIHLDDADHWDTVQISFMNRVAELAHLERFEFAADREELPPSIFDWTIWHVLRTQSFVQ